MARKARLYGLLQSLSLLAFTKADFNGTASNNCVNFDLGHVEELVSTLDISASPLLNSTADYENNRGNLLPFGALRIDWFRLSLLRDALPEDSVLRSKFKHVFRLLLIAYDEATKSTKLTSESEVLENDNVAKKTTESFFTEKYKSTQGIYKQSSIAESEEFLSSTSQEPREKLKMPSYISTSDVTSQYVTDKYEIVTKNDVDKVSATVSNESSPVDYIEENSTGSSIPETTSALIESPTKSEQAVRLMTMSESYFDPTDAKFVNHADTTPTTIVTKPRKPSYFEGTIPITITIFDEGIFTNSNDESTSSSILDEVPPRTVSTLLSDVVGKESTLSHDQSHGTSKVVSSNFTSSTEPIVNKQLEQLPTGEEHSLRRIIFYSFSKESPSSSTITNRELSASTAMVTEDTLWMIPSTVESSTSESLKLTTTEKASSSRIVEAENLSSDQPLTTMNPAELSSTRDEYSSTRIFGMSSVTAGNTISTPKEQFKKTSWMDLSSTEQNSLAGTFGTSHKTNSQFSTTNAREEVLMSREQDIKDVTTQFPTFEDYSSTPSFFDLKTTNADVLNTTPSENRLVSTNQETETNSWIYLSSIATDPIQRSDSTEFSTEIYNVTLKSLQQKEPSSSKVPTQSTVEVESPSEHSISQVQEIWATSMSIQESSTEQTSGTINPMDNVDAKIHSNHRIEVMTNEQTTPNESIFTGSDSTEFSTKIYNVTLTSLQQKEPSSSKVPTQSTVEVESPSEHSISQVQEIWTTSTSTQESSTEQTWETINPMGNVDAKINSNHQMEVITNEQTTPNESIFTGSSTIFSSSGDLVEQTEHTDFPGAITMHDSTAMQLSTVQQVERTTSTGLYLSGSSTIENAEESTEGLSHWQYPDTENPSKNETFIENVGTNNQRNETGRTTQQTDTSDIMSLSKTSSSLEFSTAMAKPHLVKNPLHHSPSRKNNIFHDYKHVLHNSIKEQNSESPEVLLYDSVTGSKNEIFWRPDIARISPVGNTIRQFDTFSKNFPPGTYQQPLSPVKTTNADGPTEQEDLTKWPLYHRTNMLRSRKRGSANSAIEKQFRWFYRQSGQLEGEDKSRDEDGSKINIQCKNAQRR